jgi:hypothetical protein
LGGRQPWGGCIFGCFALSPESGIIYQHRVKPGGFSGWFYTTLKGAMLYEERTKKYKSETNSQP